MTIDLINVVAGIATIIGFVISVLQTIRYRNSQRDLQQVKRLVNAVREAEKALE